MSVLLLARSVIDGTGGEPLADAQILVKDGRIDYIGPRRPDITGDRIVDLSDKTVLPGLIDAHVHLMGTRTSEPMERFRTPHDLATIRAAADARQILLSGVTTCRCCGSSIGPSLRRAVEEGTLEGPTIITCGKSISQTAGHGDAHYVPLEWARTAGARIADGPDECRLAVREQLRDGVDFIKVHVSGGSGSEKDDPKHRQYTSAELEAIVDEAHAAGRMVAVHAHGKAGIDNAIRAGVDTIEHGTYMDEESALMIRDAGAFLVPTLSSVYRNITYGPQTGITEWRLRKSRQGFEHRKNAFHLALKLGLKIAAGTDNLGSPMRPHGISAQELELMVEYGMTPMQAIVSATKTAAEACGLGSELGTLAPGLHADIIAVDGDPLKEIALLHQVSFIMRHGRIVAQKGSA